MRKIPDKIPKYHLDQQGNFTIENYNFARPFANFFPGISGKYGIPMWVFYVNRGQAIASFGTKDKDHSILEFFPANRAWQFVPALGFRTFLKINSAKTTSFYEPFHNGFTSHGYKLSNRMQISAGGLSLEETNSTLGLNIKVKYFNIPNDTYAGLARTVTITNLSRKAKKIQLLDGLPQIIPFGTSNLFLKKLSRTIEAWMDVKNLENNVAFYKLDVDPTDRPEIIHIKEGNFYLGFSYNQEKVKIIRPIVDPENIFGPVTDFSCPHEFLKSKNFAQPQNELTKSKTPCAFLLLNQELKPSAETSFYSIVGNMRNLDLLNSSIKRIAHPGYIAKKEKENRAIIDQLQNDVRTKSSSSAFDFYTKQTYLDNILRGGYPIVFPTKESGCVFYLYSRKHGDLERDYNKFQIQPTYFSQGNGNYRDINQNRRCDTFFNPEIKDENLILFFNLLQTDGFNPLVIKGLSFSLQDIQGFKKSLPRFINETDAPLLLNYLGKPFAPGEVIFFLEESKIHLKTNYDEFLNTLLSCSTKIQEAEHGEGFWTDHWMYNLDLLDAYLAVYPEKLKEILFEKRVFTYYDNSETVRPRAEKYMLYNGLPRQLNSLAVDTAKKELIGRRSFCPHVVRSNFGNGEIYQTTLINKLFCLVVNKLISLDPFGVGIEMEANKPNWYDALNGLPALFGSSLCETLELKRLLLLIKDSLSSAGIEELSITEEIYHLINAIYLLLQEYFSNNSTERDFTYWDKSYGLKEEYRHKTRLGLSGKEEEFSVKEILEFLNLSLRKLELGINRAQDQKDMIYYTYFINEVTEYKTTNGQFIQPLKFRQKPLPYFLESQMHALRLADNQKDAQALYAAVKKSALFDKKLKMYKVTAPLASMPEEIGRCRIFTPGWLENESIWLHMEYKYLLETLGKGLFEEFYADFKNVLIPFQKAARYGRNILENSSFLVSSAFPDKKLHGNGYVARLSGSTAEFLQIWLMMNLGKTPFILNGQGQLNLRFAPVLAGWLFDKKGLYSFNFLSNIRLNYHNPKRKNTFGKDGVRIKKINFTDQEGNPVEISSDTIPSPYAGQIRLRKISEINIYLE